MAILIFYPIANAFYFSFTDQSALGGKSSFVGLQTYFTVLTNKDYLNSILNSVIWTLGNVVVQTLLGLGGALVLNEKLKGVRWARSLVLLPWMVPTVVAAIIFHFMLSAELGVVNYYLMQSGIVERPLVLLGSPQNAMPTAILINSWRFVPFVIVLILAGLKTIPLELYEAANIDGASSFQKFRYLTMPSLQPILAAVGLIGTIWQFNYFDFPYLLTQGGPGLSTTTMPVIMYRLVVQYLFTSRAYVLSVIMFAILTVFSFLYVRRVKPGQ